MQSRDAILDSLRRHRPAPADLPRLDHPWTTYSDPKAKFIEVLESIGGKAIVARQGADLKSQLEKLPHVATARKIVSLVPGVASLNVNPAEVGSPHGFADIDVAVLGGEFAVAENAAVWVTDRKVSTRVLFFLCQHLVLVVQGGAIVDHMHAAYARIAAAQNGRPLFAEPVFSAFIAGPSKTADIEQSLVIGAHGPRSLTVCLVDG